MTANPWAAKDGRLITPKEWREGGWGRKGREGRESFKKNLRHLSIIRRNDNTGK